jgi:NADPH:quinone reductase-like Zn-dependent oxidoreductase
MKAIVSTEYGPPEIMRYTEVDKPSPKEGRVLIRIHAASVNAFDWHMLKADPFFFCFLGSGLFKPKMNILGADVAGVVEAVGADVSRFKPGDEIYGDVSSVGCGGFAEYVCAREDKITKKPAAMSFEEAAAIPMAALTALQGLRDHGGIQAGQSVLINGASGGVGTFAVQIAKAFDTEVTAVCSTGKMEMARSLGADHVIDYTNEDFTKSGNRYDLIFAAYGNSSIFDYKRALNPNGIFVVAGGSISQFFQTALLGPILSKTGGSKFRGFIERPNSEDLQLMAEYFEADKVRPVIDRKYPLSETPDAVRYVNEGHAKGKVVITVVE